MNEALNGPAFLYGESVFTTIKILKGKAFELESHLNKLLHDAVGYYQLSSYDQLKQRVFKKINIPNISGAMRITVFGLPRNSLISNFREEDLEIHISFREVDFSQEQNYRLKLIERVQPDDFCQFKIGSYGKELWMRRCLNKLGINDALYFGNNKVFETSTANIFFVKDEKIYTPKDGIYKGLTRKKIKAIEKDIFLDELENYDEIFLANSLYEKINVIEIMK